tara:strand:+ start:496 stop:864 length:369 start_codon:yes stop_codon:yes gene_type:complete
MIILLTSLYFLYASLLLYTYSSGYSFLRYILKRKNVKILLSIESIFVILGLFIIATDKPFNIIVLIILASHLVGIFWIISDKENFYSIVDENMTWNSDMVEKFSAITLIAYGIFVYISRLII